MPWDCNACGAAVLDDRPDCPECANVKTAWTVVPDKTRTLVITRSRLTVLRGDRDEDARPEGALHDAAELSIASVAPVSSKAEARRVAARGHQPGSRRLLFVRVEAGAKRPVRIDLGIDLARGEFLERSIEAADGGAREVSDGVWMFVLLLVAGPGATGDLAFPGIHVVDVTEDTDRGFAPAIEISRGKGKPVELPTERAAPPAAPVRIIPGGCFAFDSAFPSAGVAEVLADAASAVELDDEERPRQRLVVFGHTDPSGSDAYNKRLSDRRAQAILALLRSDLDLFDAVAADDGWGDAEYQAMLRGLEYNPGAIDGQPGALTAAAVRGFARDYEAGVLHEHAERGPARRGIAQATTLSAAVKAALRDGYVTSYGMGLPAEAFVGPAGGPPCAGCSEFNPATGEPERDRRVTLAVVAPDEAPAPAEFPCKAGDAGACALDRPVGRRCSFYRELVVEDEPLEPTPMIPFYDFQWLRTPTGKVHLSCVTPLPDSNDVTVVVQRWSEGQPRAVDSSGQPEPPEVGPELARLPGLIRRGVAYALWDAPEDQDPLSFRRWFLGAPGEAEARLAPPVFRVEAHGRWAISSPPGWRLDGVRFTEGLPARRVVALRNDGALLLLSSPEDVQAAGEDVRVIAVRVPGKRIGATEERR